MKQPLKIACVQTNLYWEDVHANLAMLEEKISGIDYSPDIIILPEMFNTGFSMQAAKLAEPINGHTFKWLKLMATQTQSAICGSFMVKEDTQFYNRFTFMQPNGCYYFYDKMHLFSLSGEDVHFTKGEKKVIFEYLGWKIMPQVCYDLRFPEACRNHINEKGEYLYDLLIYVANWPAQRHKAWETLLPARAIENQCYTVGVNRTGTDGNSLKYMGGTACHTPTGECVLQTGEAEGFFFIELSNNDLAEARQKMPFLKDAIMAFL